MMQRFRVFTKWVNVMAALWGLTATAQTMPSLPSGPGSIDGLGESFLASPNVGTGHYTYAIEVPPGRAGFTPDLRIDYNGGNGNGTLGLGMRLNLPYVQRQTSKGLPLYDDLGQRDRHDNNGNGEVNEYDEADTFIDHQGNELVPVGAGVYRAEIESAFIRYERLADGGWLWHYPDGSKLYLGTATTARLQNADRQVVGGWAVYRWYPEKHVDPNGNTIYYHYRQYDGLATPYLDRITYNHHNDRSVGVRFGYESRPDILTDYRPGFEWRITRRLQSITTFAADDTGFVYRFAYTPVDAHQTQSLLESITLRAADDSVALPALMLSWSQFDPAAIQREPLSALPAIPVESPNVRFYDLNGDGLMDVVNSARPDNHYWINEGPDVDGQVRFSPRQKTAMPSGRQFGASNIRVADVDGNGVEDMMVFARDRVNVVSPHMGEARNDLVWQVTERLSSPALPFDSPSVRFVDVNHDRRVDALFVARNRHSVSLNLDGGWSRALRLPVAASAEGLDLSRPGLFMADMNGDRLMDMVAVAKRSGGFSVDYYPGRGLKGFGDRIASRRVSTDRPVDLSRMQWADVNGDGRADLLQLVGGEARLWINQGLQVPTAGQRKGADLLRFADTITVVSPIGQRRAHPSLLDINGNGSLDIVWYERTQVRGAPHFAFAELAPGVQPGQITSIANGLGEIRRFEYRSLAAFARDARLAGRPWTTKVPLAMQVLSAVEIRDGMTDVVQRTEYRYRNGHYHPLERTFWGFEQSEVHYLGEHDDNTLVVTTDYLLGQEDKTLKGLDRQSVQRSGTGHVFNRTVSAWQAVSVAEPAAGERRHVRQPRLQSRTVHHVEGVSPEQTLSTRTDYEYDNYGNTTAVFEQGCLDDERAAICSHDQRTTRWRYSADFEDGQSRWHLRLPVEHRVYGQDDVLVREEHFFYDDEQFAGDNPGQLSRGLLTLVRSAILPAHHDVTVATMRRRYDTYGNMTDDFGPLWGQSPGHHTRIAYDPLFATFPVSRRQDTGKQWLDETFEYDPRFGTMLAYTDVNDAQTAYKYDGLARLIHHIRPGDSMAQPTWQYEYDLGRVLDDGRTVNRITTRQREHSDRSGTLDKVQYLDGLGREHLVLSEGVGEQVIVSRAQDFDRRGLLRRAWLAYEQKGWQPVVPDGDRAHTQHRYDALGRRTVLTQARLHSDTVASEALTDYLPLAKVVRDEAQTAIEGVHAGARKVLHYDGLINAKGEQRLIALEEHVKVAENGDPVSTIRAYRTRYRYDALDQLREIINSRGERRLLFVDALGREYARHDASRGMSFNAFDDAGNVRRSRDARGQEIHYDYDGINRPTAEYSILPTHNAGNGLSVGDWWHLDTLTVGDDEQTLIQRFWYDTAPDNDASLVATRNYSAGQLVQVHSPAGVERWHYDARGRKMASGFRPAYGALPSNGVERPDEYVTIWEYDPADRVVKKAWPDDTVVDYHYNTRGLLQEVSGAIESIRYTAHGAVQSLTYANGLVSEHVYDLRDRLSQVRSQRADGTVLQALSYDYDPVSNITAIRDERSSQDFATLARELRIDAQTARVLDDSTDYAYDDFYRLIQARRDAVIGRIDYRYDPVGSTLSRTVQQQSAHGAITPLPNLTLAYDASSPERIAAINDTNYAYDAAGALMADERSRFFWDPKLRLRRSVRLANGAESDYFYDHDNTRRIKVEWGHDKAGPEISIYLAGDAEWRDGKLYKYVMVGGQRLALTAQDGGQFKGEHFYLVHHNRSSALTTDRDGRVLDAIAYYPFGGERYQVSVTDGNLPPTPYRFAGKELDRETGLNYFEQRYLFAGHGRFITPDPVDVLPSRMVSSQAWHTYSYAANNPLKYGDNSGEFLNFAIKFVADVALNAAVNYVTTGEVNLTGALTESVTGLVDPTKTLKKAKKLATALRARAGKGKKGGASPNCVLSCFVAGTTVQAENGPVAIEQLRAGDRVWAHDPETGLTVLKPVLRAHVNTADAVWLMTVEDEKGQQETFEVTGSHPYYVEGSGWVEVSRVVPGHTLRTRGGTVVKVIDNQNTGHVITTYNIEVADMNTYYVGSFEVLVHNMDCNPRKGAKGVLRYKLKPQDKDWRGTGKTYKDALDDAFKQTGLNKSDFIVTKWGKNANGKSFPVEYRHKSGAEVNIDWAHSKNGPDAPHVGWQTAGKRGNGGAVRGHTILDSIPYNR